MDGRPAPSVRDGGTARLLQDGTGWDRQGSCDAVRMSAGQRWPEASHKRSQKSVESWGFIHCSKNTKQHVS